MIVVGDSSEWVELDSRCQVSDVDIRRRREWIVGGNNSTEEYFTANVVVFVVVFVASPINVSWRSFNASIDNKLLSILALNERPISRTPSIVDRVEQRRLA